MAPSSHSIARFASGDSSEAGNEINWSKIFVKLKIFSEDFLVRLAATRPSKHRYIIIYSLFDSISQRSSSSLSFSVSRLYLLQRSLGSRSLGGKRDLRPLFEPLGLRSSALYDRKKSNKRTEKKD